MAKITLPVDPVTRRSRSIGKLMQPAAERWKPEAM